MILGEMIRAEEHPHIYTQVSGSEKFKLSTYEKCLILNTENRSNGHRSLKYFRSNLNRQRTIAVQPSAHKYMLAAQFGSLCK